MFRTTELTENGQGPRPAQTGNVSFHVILVNLLKISSASYDLSRYSRGITNDELGESVNAGQFPSSARTGFYLPRARQDRHGSLATGPNTSGHGLDILHSLATYNKSGHGLLCCWVRKGINQRTVWSLERKASSCFHRNRFRRECLPESKKQGGAWP